MIAYLEGILAETWNNACIVVTSGGIGYEVSLPSHTWASLPARGEQVVFYISHVVREDAQELYGFASFEERNTFEILLSISKVGARTALAILSLFRPAELRQIVFEEDIISLTRVPGIGKKSAQHIFLELKYKLKAGEIAVPPGCEKPQSVLRDVVAALTGLGYSEEECSPVIADILRSEPDLDVASAVRASLQALGKQKK